jgi:hypothetical protein
MPTLALGQARCGSRYFSAIGLVAGMFMLVPRADAGVVKTLDGKTLEGQILLEDKGQLAVRTRGGGVLRMELGNVLSAHFRAEETAAGTSTPGRWIGRDLGAATVPGSVRFVGDTVTIRASGGDMSGASDAGYFVHQPMEGDGQIVANITAVQQTERRAAAGVIIRASPENTATYGMMLAYAGGGIRFQCRPKVGMSARTDESPGAGTPCWVKLVRKGDTLLGYSSPDGESWELVRSERVNLPATVQIGLAVSARNNAAVCTATFERVAVTAMSPKPESKASAGGAPRGVLLRQGSLVAGQANSANDSVLRIARDREFAIPLAEVARIYFSPVKPEMLQKLKGGRKGVLLTTGDFFEGDVLGIEGASVRLSSVLFGLKRFETWRVAAVLLNDGSKAPTRYEIKLTDGSELLADQVTIDKSVLAVEGRSFGTLKFGAEQIVEIRIGAARYKSLSELKPVAVESDAGGGAAVSEDRFMVDGVIGGRMSLGGQACARGLGLAAGTSVTFGLDGNYSLLVFRAGVPDGVLPAGSVKFVVRGDGKELYRSPDRTAMDEPIAVTLVVGGVKSLVLRVEGGPASMVGGSGLLAEAALVK